MHEDYADWMEQRATHFDDDMVPDIDDVIRMAEEFQDVLNTPPGFYVWWMRSDGKPAMTEQPFTDRSGAEFYCVLLDTLYGLQGSIVECS